MSLTILADDLTGACDTGALFAGKAFVPVTVWPRAPHPAPVRVVDTETRARSAEEAADRVRAIARGAPATSYFKKIDSTLRGRIGAEVAALAAAVGAAEVLLCPAFPAVGRAVVDRVLLIEGTPITETTLAHDPEFPRRAGPHDRRTGSVIDLLRPQLDRPLAWIPLAEVRRGAALLTARLSRLAGTVVLADAETDADLEGLVQSAFELDRPPLLVGAAGLARALARHLGLLAERAALPRGGRWLVVAGSLHPMTRRQVTAAREAGLRVLASGSREEADPPAVARRLAGEARRALETEAFDLVAVTGGETAVALYEALEAERIDLVGAPGPGLAFGYLRTPRHPALPLLTKAGAFGAPDLFVSLREKSAA
ncbi:MAG: four-carbon acid sugar kinase family protein [Candidatus Rokubacteria bacterium]|nr:four-carbon acid sugar kinase family protein [Candidatus Rokubacteria bacterium]